MNVIPHNLRARLSQQRRERAWFLAPIGTVAIALAVGAQIITSQRVHPSWGAALFLIAAILFLFPPYDAATHQLRRSPLTVREGHGSYVQLVRWKMWRWAFLINGIVLSGVAFAAFEGNRLDRGLWIWLIGVMYLSVALAERPAIGLRQWVKGRVAEADWRFGTLIVIITVIAAFFRMYKLGAIPVEMTSDHAEKLLDVFDVLQGRRSIFFPRNTGREALQFYLTAALIQWTPLDIGHLALKVGTAIVGILTVPWTYLLGKELFGKRTGALAAFLLAVSYWHVTISRVGLRFPFTAAFVAPALVYLVRAIRTNHRNDWLAAGAFLGVGLHTYTAMRIVPVLFVLMVSGSVSVAMVRRFVARRLSVDKDLARDVSLTRRFWANAFAGAALSLAVFLPLLRYMVENPDAFWYRAASRVQGIQMSWGDMWRVFWSNTWDALLMFNYRGDTVPMNTIPEETVLGPVIGGLFVLGAGLILWRLFRYGDGSAALTILSFFVLLLPSVMSFAFPGENPSVVRTGGAIPIVMIMAALPIGIVLETIEQTPWRSMALVMGIFVVLLLGSALAYNYDWYFRRYDANIRQSLWNATEMGQVLQDFERSGGELANAYHVAYPHWVDTRNIAINAGNIAWRNAVTDLTEIAAHAKQPGRKLYLVFPSHTSALKVLREVYPQAELRLQPSVRPGKSFYVFEVPG